MSRKHITRADLLKGEDGMVRKAIVAESVEPIDGSNRSLRFCISTGAVDRDNDTIAATGWKLDAYKQNPVVLWAHDYSQLPIGKATNIGVEGGKLVADAEFADHAFAETVFRMLKGGFLRATSVGFSPMEYKVNEQRGGGLDFTAQELLEFSVVPVPANPEALIEARAAGIDTEPLKAWADGVMKSLATAEARARDLAAATDLVLADGRAFEAFDAGGTLAYRPKAHFLSGPSLAKEAPAADDPVRWNRSLSKAFDVDGEPLEASRLEYTWTSRFLSTPVKDLYETTLLISGARMGAMLSGLDDALAAYKVETIRNLSSYEGRGKELPPVYETLQLNSTTSRSFLIEGLRFLSGPMKMVAKVQPTWAGLALTVYGARAAQDRIVDFVAEIGTRASRYKYLKGEAFALSGDFLLRGENSLTDLFLTATNLDPIRRTAQLINEQGAKMERRGLVLMGPPGTGKTLAGRALLTEAKDATFIWASARDFARLGDYGCIQTAFDLAAENAPAIVFFEDVDASLAYCTDLLKTELDGVRQSRGIVTILTTNFPELLPKALIDRPGRFHDVLRFDLPDETLRRKMLHAWAPDAPVAVLASVAQQSEGFSGAHLRELVRFADVLRDQEKLQAGPALERALDKVREQRALIDEVQAPTRRYRSVKALVSKADDKAKIGTCTVCGAKDVPLDGAGMCSACMDDAGKAVKAAARGACSRCAVEMEPAVALCGDCVADLHPRGEDWREALYARTAQLKGVLAKRGRVLSAANEGRLRQASDLLGEVLSQLRAVEPDPDPDAAPPADDDSKAVALVVTDEIVLDIADEDPVMLELADDDEGFSADEQALIRCELAGALSEALGSLVRQTTEAAINRARGRAD